MAGVAGRSGATPKRSSEKMGHRTKAELASIDRIQVAGTVEQPPPETHWHPVARDWYASLSESGQAIFFEPSDWAAARYVAEAVTENLYAGKFSAQLFASVWSAMGDLMTTEASRRRLRLELERAKSGPTEAERNEAVILDYKNVVRG